MNVKEFFSTIPLINTTVGLDEVLNRFKNDKTLSFPYSKFRTELLLKIKKVKIQIIAIDRMTELVAQRRLLEDSYYLQLQEIRVSSKLKLVRQKKKKSNNFEAPIPKSIIPEEVYIKKAESKLTSGKPPVKIVITENESDILHRK